MARILIQTTAADGATDDWTVDRFSLLAEELHKSGHQVTTRNLEEAGTGWPLRQLDRVDVDQLWLMAADSGDGLSAEDADGVERFRACGGGVLTARDHQDLGSSLGRLGTIGRLHHFHTSNPEPGAERDDQDNESILWPNYHSGSNGNYQPVIAENPVHELLRTRWTTSGRIEWFPAHPHEGAVSVPSGFRFGRVVARGRSLVTGRMFNLAVAVDGEISSNGVPLGRAVACSTFHHFADMNWTSGIGAPSYVTDVPGDEIERDPHRLAVFKDYVRNLALWLQGPDRSHSSGSLRRSGTSGPPSTERLAEGSLA